MMLVVLAVAGAVLGTWWHLWGWKVRAVAAEARAQVLEKHLLGEEGRLDNALARNQELVDRIVSMQQIGFQVVDNDLGGEDDRTWSARDADRARMEGQGLAPLTDEQRVPPPHIRPPR